MRALTSDRPVLSVGMSVEFMEEKSFCFSASLEVMCSYIDIDGWHEIVIFSVNVHRVSKGNIKGIRELRARAYKRVIFYK